VATLIGRTPESLTPADAIQLAGQFVALELYSPETTPLRLVEALGESPEDCIRELAARGRDPRQYEFVRLKPPF
jgi:hypothetical protein